MTQFNDYHVQQPHTQQPMQPQPVPDDPLAYTPIYQPAEPDSRARNSTLSSLVAFALLLIAAVIGVAYRKEAGVALGSMQHIGPGHSTDEQIMGLVTVGVILISILAAVRILVNNNNDRRGR